MGYVPPKFSEKKQVSNLLEKEIHSMTIREAVESGMLCSVSSIIVRTEADISKVKTKDGEYDEKELEKAVNIASRNKAAVDLYKKIYVGQLTVAYCVGINHAADVAKEFNGAGVSAAYISGKTPKKEQEEILERFHKGDIKVLCNADLLIAGFDEPKASACLNLRPTQSRIDAEQRGGRVLRLDKNKPKKLATVVDFLDKNYSADKPPVLFADVAEGANFYFGRDNERSSGGGRSGDGVEVPKTIEIEGVEVIYDSEEVMKISRKMVEEREKNKKVEKITDYNNLKVVVRAAVKAKEVEVDIKNLWATYGELLKLHLNWPQKGHMQQIDGFVSVYDLFGVELIKDYTSLKAAVQAAVKAGEVVVDVKSLKNSYLRLREKYLNWPREPWKVKGFISMPDLFGIELIKDYISLKAVAQAAVKAKEVEVDVKNLGATYLELYNKHTDWPKIAKAVKGFINMYDLFGVELIKDYTSLKAAVQAAVKAGEVVVDVKNLRATYTELQKKHPNWIVYVPNSDGYVSAHDLFGIEKQKK